MEEGSRRAIVAAFAANLAIAVAKFAGFAFTASASMLAEAVHSVADTSNQALLIVGGRRSRREPSPQHPFGYGRERYFWSFVVALVIFSLGAMFALFEAEEKLRAPHEVESAGVGIGILAVAIVFEALSLRTAARESRPHKGDMTWWQFIRRARTPELPVVLLEDTGALFGLAFALAGLVLAHVTGNSRFDAVGSLAIGLLLGAIAITLMIEMKSLLIGEAALPDEQRRIHEALESHPRVLSIIHLRTEHLSPDQLLVGAKLHFDESLDLAGVAQAIDEVEARLRAAVPAAGIVYIEPDVRRPPSR